MQLHNISFGQQLTIKTIDIDGKKFEDSIEINTGLYPQTGDPTRFSVLPYEDGYFEIEIHNEGDEIVDEEDRIKNRIGGVPLGQLRRAWSGLFDMMQNGEDTTIRVNRQRETVAVIHAQTSQRKGNLDSLA